MRLEEMQINNKFKVGDCFYLDWGNKSHYMTMESGYISVTLYENGDRQIEFVLCDSVEEYTEDLAPSTLGEFMTAFRTAKTVIDSAVSQVLEDLDKVREGA
jgi:hypothetical protein